MNDPFASLFKKTPQPFNTLPAKPKVLPVNGVSSSMAGQNTQYLNGVIDPFKSANNTLSSAGAVKPITALPTYGPTYSGPQQITPVVPMVTNPSPVENQGAIDFNKRIDANIAANQTPAVPQVSGQNESLVSQAQQQGSAPTIPADPMLADAQATAEKAYADALKLTPDELTTQEDIDRLIESTKAGYENIRGQGEGNVTPLRFISGQLSAVERRATNLAEPLEAKLARLQAVRQNALSASQFALDRADKKIEQQSASKSEASAMAEDTRRFEESQKLAKEELALKYSATGGGYEAPVVKQFGDEYKEWNTTTGQWDTIPLSEIPNTAKVEKAQQVTSVIEELLNDPALATAVGPISSKIPTLRGTTADFEYKLNSLKALLTLENMGIMKGVLSDADIKIISAASTGGLNIGMSESGFRDQLKKIQEKMRAVLDKVNQGQTNSGDGEWSW